MKRTYVSKGKDKKIFKRTAQKTKRLNVNVENVPRGGIRL